MENQAGWQFAGALTMQELQFMAPRERASAEPHLCAVAVADMLNDVVRENDVGAASSVRRMPAGTITTDLWAW